MVGGWVHIGKMMVLCTAHTTVPVSAPFDDGEATT